MSEKLENTTLNQLTLLPGDSLASLTVSPGSAEARMMTATSGRNICELYERSNPPGWWVRTFLESLLPCSTMFFLTWNVQVTPQQSLIFQLAHSEPTTSDTESLSWPTPLVTDIYTGNLKSSQQKEGSKHSLNLSGAVNRWPTPTKQDYKRRGPNSRQQGLPEKIHRFPTPQASDANRGPLSEERYQKNLGGPNLISEINHRTGATGGQLNPIWVEWLMGFPLGWTEIGE